MQTSSRLVRNIFVIMVLLAVMLAPCLAKAAYTSKVIDKHISEEMLGSIPPALQGKAFGLYYKGSAVELIKMRLQELGYYKWTATFHNKFDDLLRSRVRSFQRCNGLEENGKIDQATLAVLYSDNPIKGEWYNGENKEPEMTLIIPITKSAQWYLSAENEIGFRVTVKNIADRRTITAYEAAMYAVNMQGERIHETQSLVMSGKIAPRETAWTTYVYMADPQEIQAVYVALKRVRYEDGTYKIVENPVYDCFILQEMETDEAQEESDNETVLQETDDIQS